LHCFGGYRTQSGPGKATAGCFVASLLDMTKTASAGFSV
jgi:hypothetical protein